MSTSSFTDQARAVLELARGNASTRHHDHVDPEHILLGLIAERDGAGAAALKHLGVDLSDVQTRVEGQLKSNRSSGPTGPDLPYTPRAKRVLEFAMRESRDLKHTHVGSEHLVMGVLRERGPAARVLAKAGASLDVLRRVTLA